MADTTLTLSGIGPGESFEFTDTEIPEKIPGGGSQSLITHKLIGGVRVVDAMGRDDRDIEWSGWFLGADAVTRAHSLDAFRVAGTELTLSYDEFNYDVIVKEFEFVYERFYKVSYRIVCLVVADNTIAPTTSGSNSADDAVTDDMSSVQTLSDSIADPVLSVLIDTLSTAVGAVTSFANAAQSTINSVLAPLQAVQGQIGDLIDAGNISIEAAVGFSGIAVGASFGDAAIGLSAQISVNTRLSSLYQARNLCGRMANNLGAIYASDNTITVAGGNLFRIASEQYGDATAWTTIAKANGLTDPEIAGLVTLTIPAQPDNSGGILSF
jgi:hypothetical protein